MASPAASMLLVSALAPLVACAQSPGPATPYRLRGTVRDATTGEPVPRRTTYLHFFCDDASFQRSLDPDDDAEFDVALPTPNVRVRAFDKERTYAFLTETFTLGAAEVERDIRLRPTGYVLLRARVVDAATNRPIVRPPRPAGESVPVGDAGPLFALASAGGDFDVGMIGVDEDGRFELKVPRALLHVRVVDTAQSPVEGTIDLTGAVGPAFEYVLRMR